VPPAGKMNVAVPLALVVGLIVLSLALLTVSGFSHGPTAMPISLQIVAVWLCWVGTLIGFLYSCAPSFSLSCDSWDSDFAPYKFFMASADALALSALGALLFTLNSGCERVYDVIGPRYCGSILTLLGVLLFVKLVGGLSSLHSAEDDTARLNVAVMGGSFGTVVLACALSVVQLKAQRLANPFLPAASICAPAPYYYADTLLKHTEVQSSGAEAAGGAASSAEAPNDVTVQPLSATSRHRVN